MDHHLTLWIGVAFSLIVSLVYFFIANTLKVRQFSPLDIDSKWAWNQFLIFWWSMGIVSLMPALQNVLGIFDVQRLSIYASLLQLILVVISVALWALQNYVFFIYFGTRKFIALSTLYYSFVYGFLLYFFAEHPVTRLKIERWNVLLDYGVEPSSQVIMWLSIILILPLVLSALGYFSLYFRVKDATSKYRIFLVSWSLIIWLASGLVVRLVNPQFADSDEWQMLNRVIAVASSVLIFFAYRPPRFIKSRFKVLSIGEE